MTFDEDGRIISCDLYDDDDDTYHIMHSVFEGLWFDFPTPFQKGDILCEYDTAGKDCYDGPFVMLGIAHEQTNGSRKEYVDSTDMTAWGYFLDVTGRIYSEVMFNYMDLEYYRGEFTGYRRSLKAFSSFVKNEIDATLLCNVYHQILCDEDAKRNVPIPYTERRMEILPFEAWRVRLSPDYIPYT